MTARADFVEGFALTLTASGVPRMPSRVFAALLVAPEHGLTAREIGEVLGVSAGAVSGATGYLTRTGLAARRRVPGERADRFDVSGTTWAETLATETESIRMLSDWLRRGAEAAADDPVAVGRLDETRDFFDFLVVELPLLVERWRTERTGGAR